MAKITDTSAQDITLEAKSGSKKLAGIIVSVVAALVLFALLAPLVQRWSLATESVSGERLRTATVVRSDFVRDISVQGRVVAAVSPTL
jgi:HlyD family secretion protein